MTIYHNLPLLGGTRTATPPGTIWTAERRPVLAFDDTTDETIMFSWRMPDEFSTGLRFKVQYSMASATANNVALRAEIMAASVGDPIATGSFDTINVSADQAVPGSSGNTGEITITPTNLDGLTRGDYICVILGRENGTSGTNAAGDMYWWTITALWD